MFLVVQVSGVKSWEFRWKRDGAVRGITIGTYPDVGLKAARLQRDRFKVMIADGRDPRVQKTLAAAEEQAQLDALRAKQDAERAAKLQKAATFEAVALEWVERHRQTWTELHGQQVEQSLRDHVFPMIGAMPIDSISTSDVLAVLDSMLARDLLETASRVKQRLSAIYEFAGLKYQVKVDPTSLVRKEFSRRLKLARRATPVQNFATVKPEEAPELLRALARYSGSGSSLRLVRFLALTARRTGEARCATWSEIDLERKLWTIPAERMKARRLHVVPLSDQAVDLLKLQNADGFQSKFAFPNPTNSRRPASENAVLYVLAAIGYRHRMTGHGFRSLFSTIANESGKWRAEMIETALAHTEQDDTRAAYLRTSYLEERGRLMQWWADELDRLQQAISGAELRTPPIVATAVDREGRRARPGSAPVAKPTSRRPVVHTDQKTASQLYRN